MSIVSNFRDLPKTNPVQQTYNDDVSFNLEEHRRIKRKRKTHRRRVTKIIHTICIATKNVNGETIISYHQKSTSTMEQNSQVIKKECQKAQKRHQKKIVQRQFQKIQEAKKVQNEPEWPQFNWNTFNSYLQPELFYYNGYPYFEQY